MHNQLLDVMTRAKVSPFYRKVLNGVTRWDEVPVTTKADLRAHYPFGLLAVEKRQIATYHESSGSEGKPISSFFTESDWEDIAARFVRSAVKLTSDDLFFIKTPYSMVTTAHQAQTAARILGVPMVPADNRSGLMPYSRVLQLLRDLEVSVTWSLPTDAIVWRVAAELNGISPVALPKLRAFWVAGEPLSSGKRDAIRLLWNGKSVFQDYGSTETGSLAGECAEGRLHLWSDRLHFEIFDSATRVLSLRGKGQLVVTPLFRQAMPLLRYLIEDEVEVTESQCGCGSLHPTIEVLGRASSAVKISGKSLFPLGIEDAVYQAGNPYSLALWRGFPEGNRLRVEYHALKKISPNAQVALQNEISRRLGIAVSALPSPLSSFLSPALLRRPLLFSKPQFIFRPGENTLRGIQYA